MELIVNADDGFYCETRDSGIVRGLKNAAITDVSVLVNGSVARTLFEASIKIGASSLYDYLHEINLKPGLHVNVTEGRPLSDGNAKTFVDNQGEMLGKEELRNRLLDCRVIDLDEIEHEIELQIDRFMALFGYLPVHVDGHQHAHVLPGINARFAKALQNHGICLTRLPVEFLPTRLSSDPAISFFKTIVEYSRLSMACFTNCGLRYPRFIGMSVMGTNLTVDNVELAISVARSKVGETAQDSAIIEYVIELMVHPGFAATCEGGCGSYGPDTFSQSSDRIAELEILESQEFKRTLERLHLKRVTFSTAHWE